MNGAGGSPKDRVALSIINTVNDCLNTARLRSLGESFGTDFRIRPKRRVYSLPVEATSSTRAPPDPPAYPSRHSVAPVAILLICMSLSLYRCGLTPTDLSSTAACPLINLSKSPLFCSASAPSSSERLPHQLSLPCNSSTVHAPLPSATTMTPPDPVVLSSPINSRMKRTGVHIPKGRDQRSTPRREGG